MSAFEKCRFNVGDYVTLKQARLEMLEAIRVNEETGIGLSNKIDLLWRVHARIYVESEMGTLVEYELRSLYGTPLFCTDVELEPVSQ